MTDRGPESPEVSTGTESGGDEAGYPVLADDDAEGGTSDAALETEPATASENVSPTTSGSDESSVEGDGGDGTTAVAEGGPPTTQGSGVESEAEPTSGVAEETATGSGNDDDATTVDDDAAAVGDDDAAVEDEEEAVGDDAAAENGDATVDEDDTAVAEDDTVAAEDDEAAAGEDDTVGGDDEAVGEDDAVASEDDAASGEDDATTVGDDGDGTVVQDTDAEQSDDAPTDDAPTNDALADDDTQAYPELAGEDSPEAGDIDEGTESTSEPAEPPADAGYPQLAGDDDAATPEPPGEPVGTEPADTEPAGSAEAEPPAPPAEVVDPQEAALQDAMARYDALGDTPPHFDMAQHDVEHAGIGAHTLERHGPEVPLARGDSPGRTIEGRIYGDQPWGNQENWSYRWADADTMNRTVNEYAANNWDTIRADLALDGQHTARFDAQRVTGEGYFNSGMGGVGPRSAEYSQARYATVNFRLVPGSDPPEVFVPTTYPSPVP